MHFLSYYINKVLLMKSLFVLITSAVNYANDECWHHHRLC